jgi:hypothetical protein
MRSNGHVVHQQRVRCLIALTALTVVLTACGIGPNDTNRMTGTSTSGTASSLATDDDNFYTTGASCNGWFGGCATEWSARFQTGGRVDGPLGLMYSGKNAGAGIQFISVWNWSTWSWVGVDAFRVVANSEVRLSVTLPAPNSQWAANGSLAFVKVTTIGNFTSSSADLLQMCVAPC